MANDLTFIIGGATAPARAIAARTVARSGARVVLVDREDPVAALLGERTPMLGHEMATLARTDWRDLVDRGQVSGAVVDRDMVPWTVGTLGLLRPNNIVICVGVRNETSRPARHAAALTSLTAELSMALAAVDEYCRLVQREGNECPRVVITVAGAMATSSANAISTMSEALANDLLPHAGVSPQLLLLPRLIGGGGSPDPGFNGILRRLLHGEEVRVGQDDVRPPHWMGASEAARLVMDVMNESDLSDDPCASRSRRASRGVKMVAVPGQSAALASLAGIMAEEMDRLLPDPLLDRRSLLPPIPVREQLTVPAAKLAEEVRFAVRWYAANASVLAGVA